MLGASNHYERGDNELRGGGDRGLVIIASPTRLVIRLVDGLVMVTRRTRDCGS